MDPWQASGMIARLFQLHVARGALLGSAVLPLLAAPAAACLRPAPLEFSLDPAAMRTDRQPPSAPVVLTASASRNNGHYCRSNGECTVSTCGSGAALQVTLTPAADDQTAPDELGYQLRWREGSLPAELEEPLRRIERGTELLRFELPFDAAPELDGTFELIAIDRAGNESVASAPFHAAFDGCTRSIGFAGCAEDSGGAISCADGACFEMGSEGEEGSAALGCGLGQGRKLSRVATGLSLALAACVLARRARTASR